MSMCQKTLYSGYMQKFYLENISGKWKAKTKVAILNKKQELHWHERLIQAEIKAKYSSQRYV